MRRRILLIGWDAADWQVIDPLLDAGAMPHLARLVERGVVGNLATLHPPYSPILWTSIATGKRPSKHGIHGFQEPTPDGLAVRPVSSLSRTTKALWNIATQQGLRSVVVGWYPSHPVEPINGVMVSDLFAKAGDGETPSPLPRHGIHPPDWTGRLDELRLTPRDLPAEVLRMFVPRLDQVDQAGDKRLHMLARVVAENMNLHAAATEALEQTEWDLACIFYDGIDHLSHGFMRYHPPRLPWVEANEFNLYHQVVANTCRWHDAMLGRLLQLAGDDAIVILVSDHGFESGSQRLPGVPAEFAGPTHDHRHFGVLAMAGPGIRRDERIHGASLLDIAPTILHLMALPVGQDMDGKVLLTALGDPAPIERIPSWDLVPGQAGQHPPGATLDPLATVEAMKQLVALGYVAPPSGDAAAAVREAVQEQYYTLAQSHDDEGRPDLAAEQYGRMLTLDPDDHRAFGGLVSARLQLNETEAAAAALDLFDAAAERVAAAAQADLQRREAAQSSESLRGKTDPASQREVHARRRLLQQAGGWRLNRALTRIRLALAEHRIADAHAALGALRNSSTESGAALSPALLASLYAGAGDEERALALCAEALTQNQQDWQTLGLRAQLHMQGGRPAAAIDDAAASLGLVYFQPALHLLLGQAQAARGAHEDAARALRVAVLQAPGLLAAHRALAELYTYALNRPEQAALHRGQVAWREAQRAERRAAVTAAAATPTPTAVPRIERPDFVPRPLRPAPDGRQPVIVVSGLPRSGTSMLMQGLRAGGVPPLTDGGRAPDEDNPRGYLEYTKAARIAQDASWIAQARGHAVKLVLPLLPYLPLGERYGLVLIQRDLQAVVASQARMLQRLGRVAANLTPEALAAQFARQEQAIRPWLDARPGIGVLPLCYDAVLDDPAGAAGRIAAFLADGFDGASGRFDVAACAEAIEPAMRRQGNG